MATQQGSGPDIDESPADDSPTPRDGIRAGDSGPVEQPASEMRFWSGLGRAIERLGRLKTLIALVVALLLGGVAAASWERDLVHQPQLQAEHDQAAADRAGIRADVRQLQDRVTRLEVSLTWISGALYQVAQATGARAVPPPPPAVTTEGSTP